MILFMNLEDHTCICCCSKGPIDKMTKWMDYLSGDLKVQCISKCFIELSIRMGPNCPFVRVRTRACPQDELRERFQEHPDSNQSEVCFYSFLVVRELDPSVRLWHTCVVGSSTLTMVGEAIGSHGTRGEGFQRWGKGWRWGGTNHQFVGVLQQQKHRLGRLEVVDQVWGSSMDAWGR